LQGLARNSYPGSPEDIRRLARIILELHAAVKKRLPTGADTSLMDSDAGMRLWLLAVLSVPRSPLSAASLVRSAFRLQPTSMLAFLGKVTSRLHERRAVRRRAA
jgi:hypothetical protein